MEATPVKAFQLFDQTNGALQGHNDKRPPTMRSLRNLRVLHEDHVEKVNIV